MTALLDTSVVVDSRHRTIDAALLADGFAVSSVTLGELEAAVLLAADDVTRADRLRTLTAVVTEAYVVEADRKVASHYGELRAAAGRRPSNDLWIAATARAHGLVLLTADERQAQLPLVRTVLVS